jgi:hypothetical protein
MDAMVPCGRSFSGREPESLADPAGLVRARLLPATGCLQALSEPPRETGSR